MLREGLNEPKPEKLHEVRGSLRVLKALLHLPEEVQKILDEMDRKEKERKENEVPSSVPSI